MPSVEQKYDRGDVVRHKASGEKAIVVHPLKHCVNLDHQGAFSHRNGFRDDCILEFSGSYRLDAGFSSENFDYPQDLLQLL